MDEKRYAIVRVDKDCNKCELGYKQRNGKTSCRLQWFKGFSCDNYGDTKEQLIKKVLTAIHTLTSNLNRGDTTFISYETMARKIVEFLGVE